MWARLFVTVFANPDKCGLDLLRWFVGFNNSNIEREQIITWANISRKANSKRVFAATDKALNKR